MNLKKTIALAGAAAVAASAAAGDLWSLNAPDYQVQVPCVINGTASSDINGDGDINKYDCAGWWYGYGFGPTGGAPGTYSPATPTGELITTDPTDGSVIPNGNLTATGIKITLNTPAAASDAPTGAGLGFDFQNPKAAENITANGGYIITYTATAALQMELGWDEDTYGYDTYYVALPAATTPTAKTLPFSLFSKDNWATGTGSQPLATATDQAFSLKIRLKNGTATAKTADLEVQELGWAAGSGSASVKSVLSGAGLKANLSGRSLAIAGLSKKAVSVEVISLQGEVVARQALTASSNVMNLTKVPAGVYAVKVQGKDVNMSQMVTLK